MTQHRNVAWIIMGVVLSLILSGCSSILHTKTYFADQAGGESYLIQAMNTKYGLNFEVSGNPVFNSQGSVWFSANVAVSGQPSQDAAARVTATGNLVDNFAQNLYKDQIESAHRQVCESKSFVAPCTVDINMPATSEKWDSSAPLEQFISESGVANDVRVTLVHADTDDLYATDILDLNGLYATTPSFHLFVKIGETSVFGWNSIQLHGQDKVPTRTQVLQSLAGLTGN